jgi:hypothetical protein
VRLLVLLMVLALPAAAQDDKAPARKKPVPVAKAHKKPSAEQIRRFNELEKKRQREVK